MDRTLAALGALFAFIGVAAGAFGAHALRTRLTPELLQTFETGVRYQLYHGLALILVALAYGRVGAPHLQWAGWSFAVGVIVFSGSLYVLALSGARWWGAITPIGGVCLLAGWVLFLWGIIGQRGGIARSP
jgi:uncharacterized membrane protein YgdD (TMEM256/DUF423 family)